MGHYINLQTPNGKKRWRICQARMPQNQHETNWGVCDFEKRTITLHHPLSAEEMLRTIIHESAHAACPDLSEAAIERIEASVASALMPFLEAIADDLFS